MVQCFHTGPVYYDALCRAESVTQEFLGKPYLEMFNSKEGL